MSGQTADCLSRKQEEWNRENSARRSCGHAVCAYNGTKLEQNELWTGLQFSRFGARKSGADQI